MNAIDQVELSYLEFTGDVETAELAGRVLREQLEHAAYLFNVTVEELMAHLDYDIRPVWPFDVGSPE